MRQDELLFASDLDNTLLFSHKHAQAGDVCVEHLDGKAQGFFTPKVIRGLEEINRAMCFVPVTSRSVAQFLRIQFPAGCVPRLALVANGGLLLRDGAIDEAWQAASLRCVAPWREALARTAALLAQVPIPLRARMVDDLYLFAACDSPAEAELALAAVQGKTPLTAALSGRKLYFFPPGLSKGDALRRLRALLTPQRVLCAGDSGIDVPMLEAADVAIVPREGMVEDGVVWDGTGRFSEFVVEMVSACGEGVLLRKRI